MSAKFEDLVSELNRAHSMFSLSNMSLSTVQEAMTDLQTRLHNLEAKAKGPAEPPTK